MLLVAPVGYGKTTLLSDWAAGDARRFVWIALGPGKDDAGRVVASVKRAVHDGEPPTVLVVDNAQFVTDPEAFDVLEEALRIMPPGSQLALSSRCEPRLPVGSLRAQRRVLELRAGDLAMTRKEAEALLTNAGVTLRGDGLDTMMRRTEGWPAGLYLAALSLAAQANVETALSRFAGDDRVVADYLRDEVLSRLEPDRLAFLLHTSILGALSGSLCDAVIDGSGSARMLDALARSNALLMPLDRGGSSYRHHPLFAEMLRAELRRLEPQHEARLHARASAWYEEHDDIDSAIQHAVAAGDPELSGELLCRHASSYIGHGNIATLREWLRHFREDQVAAVPALAVAAASCSLAAGEGDRTRHWTAAACRGLARPPSSKHRSLRAAAALLSAAFAERGTGQMGRDAAEAVPLAAEGDNARPLARLLGGTARHLDADLPRARDQLGEGARASAVTAPHVHALCLAQLALVEMDADDWETAAVHAARARSRVEGCGLTDYPLAALVYATSALARSHLGSVEEAHRDLRAATRLAGRLVDFIPWYEAETLIVLARGALGLGDLGSARTRLAEAGRLVRAMPDSRALHFWLAEAHSELELATGSAGDGLALTAAELRVLRMLPTHLSFPAIAAQLFVSTNTVKTHVRALYRKLDASSRSAAVAHATAAGVLDESRAA